MFIVKVPALVGLIRNQFEQRSPPARQPPFTLFNSSAPTPAPVNGTFVGTPQTVLKHPPRQFVQSQLTVFVVLGAAVQLIEAVHPLPTSEGLERKIKVKHPSAALEVIVPVPPLIVGIL
jgi:hypothetical protein